MSFDAAIRAMSVVVTVMLMLQVLSADPSRATSIGPVVALVLFAVFCAQARYLPEEPADQVHRGRWTGAAPGGSAEICAEVLRARSWIMAMGLIGPVLLARVLFSGVLGDVGQMPAGMLLD